MSLFSSTAEYYAAYRSDVPDEVARIVSDAAPQGDPRRLLDVGTGTGFVIRALLPYVDDAIGVDRDADLLAVARREFAGKPVRLVEASAEDFTVPDGLRVHLVTVCRAFHWFDRPRFLARATQVLEDDGTVAIFGDNSVWASDAPWKSATLDVLREFLGDERRAGDSTYTPPRHDFADDLQDAGFRSIRRRTVPVRRTRTVESVIGYLHSTSFASPAVLADRMDAFDEAIRERLAPLADDGLLVDENEFRILTGVRPS